MITMPDLHTALLDLLHETRDDDLKLIIGGGYGIYLKREHVRKSGVQTLLREWPEARSTNDLDLFLRPDLLINPDQLRSLPITLDKLGYLVVPGAEKYQFARPGPGGGIAGSLKIDLLTAPRLRFRGSSARADSRRVRPNPSIDLHAHPVDEAVTLEEGLLEIVIEGTTTNGEPYEGSVYVPHPFTYAMMKLFAFRDRMDDSRKDNGSYHALDIYAIVATTTEIEWEQAKTIRNANRDLPEVSEASELVAKYFSGPTSKGILRLQDSPYFSREFQLDVFRSSLTELFPSANH